MLSNKTIINKQGRIYIPKYIREELQINIGGKLVSKIKNNELILIKSKRYTYSIKEDVYNLVVGPNGRIFLPKMLLKTLSYEFGEELILRAEKGTLKIISSKHALKKIQETIFSYNSLKINLAEKLEYLRTYGEAI